MLDKVIKETPEKMMYALEKSQAKKGLWLKKVPIPSIKQNEVLIKVKKSGICGTDLHIYNWDKWAQKNIHPPIILGHEFVGIIEKVGEEVTEFKVGDRITAECHIVCGKCKNCLENKKNYCENKINIGINSNGSFSEYVAIPASNCISVPEFISDEVASYMDALGNAVHSCMSFDLKDKDILITGAGAIGLMCVAIAKHLKAKSITVTEVRPHRRELAKKLGADFTFNPLEEQMFHQKMKEHFSDGLDVGLEMSGNMTAFEQMLDHMKTGSEIALLGIFPDTIQFDMNKIITKGIHLKGVYGREIFKTWDQMKTLLEDGLDVSQIFTHEFKATEFSRAFNLDFNDEFVKIVLDWENIRGDILQ